uniref:Uncharacterized protein n=1 Tax=Moniliophthora roreri TaxID=221103 RepID=A0A0W0FNU4_MONRR
MSVQSTANTSVNFDVLLPSTLSELPRTLRSVRKRHINHPRPPLPSFGGLRRSSPPLPQLPSARASVGSGSNDTESTQIRLYIRPPTDASTPRHSLASTEAPSISNLPQEIYSHLFELAERAIYRNSLGSTDSTLSKPEDEVPLGAVHGVILSHRYRETITEMLNATEISNSSKVYEAAAKDEQKGVEG